MPPTESQTLDRKVLDVVKSEAHPTSADDVISAVRSAKVSEIAIVEAIWRLLRRTQLELTETRKLRVPGGAPGVASEGTKNGKGASTSHAKRQKA